MRRKDGRFFPGRVGVLGAAGVAEPFRRCKNDPPLPVALKSGAAAAVCVFAVKCRN